MRKIFLLIVIFLLSLILTGCWLDKTPQEAEINTNIEQGAKQKIPFDLVREGYFRGPAEAKVTMVEFSDFQCTACAQMSSIIKGVVNEYPNEVKLVYRHFPLSYHQYATKAAQAAEAAGRQGKFWQMHDLLFANYQTLNEEKITALAEELDLNMDQFNQDRQSQAISAKIKADLDDASNVLKISGTPTFYINNVEYKGQYSYSGFKEEIEKILRNL